MPRERRRAVALWAALLLLLVGVARSPRRLHRGAAVGTGQFVPPWATCVRSAAETLRASRASYEALSARIEATYPNPDFEAGETMPGSDDVHAVEALRSAHVHRVRYRHLLAERRERDSYALMCGEAFLLNLGAPGEIAPAYNGFNVNVARIAAGDVFAWTLRPMQSAQALTLGFAQHFFDTHVTYFTTASLSDVVGDSLASQDALVDATLRAQPRGRTPRFAWRVLGPAAEPQRTIEDARLIASSDGAIVCAVGTWMQPKFSSAACSSSALREPMVFAPLLLSSSTAPQADASNASVTLGDGATRSYSRHDLWKVKNLMPVAVRATHAATAELIVLDMSEQRLTSITLSPHALPHVQPLAKLTGCEWLPRTMRGSSAVKRVAGTDLWLGFAHARVRFKAPHQAYVHPIVVLRGSGDVPTRCSGVLNEVFLAPARLRNTTLGGTRGITYVNGFEILESAVLRHSDGSARARVRVLVTGGLEDVAALGALAELWIAVL